MDKLYTQNEICGMLRITPSTLRNYRRNGLAFIRLPGAQGKGGKVMFREHDVEDFLHSMMVKVSRPSWSI